MAVSSAFPPSAEWSAVMPSYEWPRNTDEQDIDYVYHGRMENLPKSTSKIVRIFLSSTFTDTYTERNLLMKNVFPEMRKYCRDKYDLDFQVVDMRWGVRQDATVDHSASELCMKEIKTCNELSLGPTFVTLLSHRYGSRPLRTRIPEQEMNILIEELKQRSAEDVEFMLQWYNLDTNAQPPEYILKPLVKFEEMEKFIQPAEERRDDPALRKKNMKENQTLSPEKYKDLVQAGNEVFQKAEAKLKQIFKELALKLLKEKRLTTEQAERYYISVTEEEIIEGIRKNERRRDRCLAFVRQLNDINLSHKKAGGFIDKTEDGKLNEEAQDLMTTLRDKTIPRLLPPENIFRFETTWSDNEGVNEKEHADYLRQFCDTFKRALKDQIDRGVQTSKFTSDKLFSEILEHGHQCVAKVERFYGREQILDKIRNYIMSGSEQPLIIWGESGCGKTSVLAKAVKMVPEWLGDDKDLIIPVRFLGTTPESSTIYQTLASISQQIIKLCSLEKQFPELPQEFADLKDIFSDILAAVPHGKRVVLFLDSLDQLAETNSAHQLHWFPQIIPKNVKIVVSVLRREHKILDKLKSMLKDTNLYVEVPNIKTETSHEILKLWLKLKKRKLSKAQEKLVDELLKREVRPLYLKLVFDEIHAWKSYEQPTYNCHTIEACLARLYSRIETKHGQVLVSKALGYLSASSNGLTELEIEDILSLDEDVLNDVYQFHIPPIRRLPSILWARIRRDLDEYIVDREADGTKVMAWYHRQFIQEANKRYLGITGGFYGFKVLKKNLPFYKNLRDYFAGIWAGDTPKPFVYSDWHCKKLNLTDPHSEAVRNVSAQPSIFTAPDGSIDIENPRYNLRKVSELPEACKNIQKHEDITDFIAKYIVLNPEFLSAWIKNKPWETVSEFITDNSRESDHNKESRQYTKIFKKQFEGIELTEEEKKTLEEAEDELKGSSGLALQMATVHQCLLLSYITVLNNPTILGADVSGRLLVYRGIFSGIDEWIDYCDTKGRQLCALVSPHLQLETPGSELLYIITNHIGPVRDVMWAEDDENICISLSEKFVVVSLEMGQVLIDTRPRSVPKDDYFHCGIASMKPFIACLFRHPWVYFFSENGDVIELIKLEEQLKGKLKELDAGHILLVNKICEISQSEEEILACVYFMGLQHLVFLCIQRQTSHRGMKIELSVFDRAGKGDILNVMVGEDESIFILDSNELSRVELSLGRDSATVDVISSQVVTEFDSKVVSHDVADNSMILSTFCGTIYIVSEKRKKLRQFKFAANTDFEDARYGSAHSVKLHKPADDLDETKLLSIACTASHLLVLIPKMFQKESVSDDESVESDSQSEEEDRNNQSAADDSGSSDSERSRVLSMVYRRKRTNNRQKDKKEKVQKSSEIKLVFRVKRRYDIAEISPHCNLIIAARDGTIDLFQLNVSNNGGKITGRFFTTIDAHGQDVTKILPTPEDILFMTASMDGTMKFWMVARAGVTRKYIPNFDRAYVKLHQVLADEETALACGKTAKSVLEWDIVKGRITKIFAHPSKKGFFIAFAADKANSKLYAMDLKSLFVWDLHKDTHSASLKKSLKRRATSKHGVEAGRKVTTEIPTAVFPLHHLIPDLGKDLQIDQICIVNNGVLLTLTDQKMYHIQIQGKVRIEKKSDNFTHFGHWKIDGRYVLGSIMESDAMVFRLYDAQNKVVTNTYMKDLNVGYEQCNSCTSSYLDKTGELIIPSVTGITLWNPVSSQTRKLEFNCKAQPYIVTSESGLCLAYVENTNEYRAIKITSNELFVEPWSRKLNESVKEVYFLTLTHDGKYILYVTDQKMLHLRRYSDGKLLALYTMHEDVCSLSVSTNNCFVVLGTFDKRLFTLVIADPNEREHDDRIAYVRTMNPGLSMEQAMALMGEANTIEDSHMSDYDSNDDEALMRATKRLDRPGTDRDMVLCLQSNEPSSDNESLSDSESKKGPGTKKLLTRESTVVQPITHDCNVCTPNTCSIH